MKSYLDNDTNSASVVDRDTARCLYYTTKIKQRIEDLQDFMQGALPKSGSAYKDQVRRPVMNAHDLAMVQSRSYIANKSGQRLSSLTVHLVI